MRFASRLLALALIPLVLILGAVSAVRAEAPAGFTSLFNGQNFSGWIGAVKEYEVVEGAIACKKGKGGILFTEKEFANFVVRLEFLLPEGGNNGLAIRYPGEGNPYYTSMELQVLDSEHPKYAELDPRQFHGSVYGFVAAERGHLRPTGKWNSQQVTVRGSTIKVELNGVTILDADLDQVTETMDGKEHAGVRRTSGHFGFAGHNDPVRFRHIYIKELE